MTSNKINIEKWVFKQLKLIKLDYDEELQQNQFVELAFNLI